MSELYEFEIIPQLERYYNDDSNWGVYTFITDDDIPEFIPCVLDPFSETREMAKGSSIVGKMQRLTIGMKYKVSARLEYNAKYKTYQYTPEMITTTIPKTINQQTQFLKTLVTELQAKNILDVYPNVVEDVMNNREIDYNKIKGIGETTWEKIKEKILDNYVISDILSMLQPLGVTFSVIKKLISEEPNPALLKEKLLDNPYIMTKVHGLGFKKVDDLALKLNPDVRLSMKRVAAFVKYYLESVGNDTGHTWVKQSELDNAVRDNINECYSIYETFIDKERKVQNYLSFEGDIVGIALRRKYEMNCLEILKCLDSYNGNFDIDIEAGIKEAEKEQGFTYTNEQRDNVKTACETNVILITGGAGCGKTTLLRALIKIYKNCSIACCSLSAKAAQRITEATGHSASTIHRLLGFNQQDFLHNSQNRLPQDVIIVDEASMINASLFYSLLSAVKEGAKVIICGDDGQLPPIGYGNVFHDLLDIGEIKTCKLTKILRQAEKSGIISDSKKIRENENPLKYPQLKVVTGELQDMTYMFRENREGMRELALNLYYRTIEKDGVDNTIIIVPCKQSKINSTEEINKIIQDKLIPDTGSNTIKCGFKEFRIGAKVIQRANNYDKGVFNGEIGYIKGFRKDNNSTVITVKFDGDKTIDFTTKEMANIELAYALTIHVTQGSGYNNVIAIIDNTHYKLLDNCLLYTAITRAKKKCLLIAEPSAFQRCVTHRASARNTWLSLLPSEK